MRRITILRLGLPMGWIIHGPAQAQPATGRTRALNFGPFTAHGPKSGGPFTDGLSHGPHIPAHGPDKGRVGPAHLARHGPFAAHHVALPAIESSSNRIYCVAHWCISFNLSRILFASTWLTPDQPEHLPLTATWTQLH